MKKFNPPIKTAAEWWRLAPVKKKKQVERAITELGYRDAGELQYHVYECWRNIITVDCAKELINHYVRKSNEH